MRTTVAAGAGGRVADEIRDRVGPWLQTREGVASASAAVVVAWVLWGPLDTSLIAGALGAAFTVVLISLLARAWEWHTAPPVPATSVASGPAGGVELAHDENAWFWRDNRGFLWTERVWFAGTGCPPSRIRRETYRQLRAWRDQGDLPVFVVRARQRQWWWWHDAFYWESGDFGPQEMRAILAAFERDDEQSIDWDLHLGQTAPIPENVMRLVFERDGGRCVVCGSDELIQYKHVVPPAMGGGNEPQNIGLVCGGCNRGASAFSEPDSLPLAVQRPV